MLSYEIERIHSILENIIGKAKNEGYSNGWRSYNCPYCTEDNMGIPDDKFNLETNVERGGIFHCWKCETHGKITKIIKDFGTKEDLINYRRLVSDISDLTNSDCQDDAYRTPINGRIELPIGFKNFNSNEKACIPALNYLRGRNIDDKIIEQFNIGYIDSSFSNEFSLRKRIIIPSYDANGNLNYWVGRDYTGNNKIRYKNPKLQKSSIIFNEKHINWYEDVVLVEGPFDHIVVPNSIPLLGKTLNAESLLYNTLFEKAQADINILLDPDATHSAYKLYKLLNIHKLKGRIKFIPLTGAYDASLIYEHFGRKGIIELMKTAKPIHEFDIYMEGL